VNVLIRQAVLDIVSTHWVRLEIRWLHPYWPFEAVFLRRCHGSPLLWTDAEDEIIRAHYPATPRETILTLLPTKSWRSIKAEAGFLGVKRTVPYTHSIIPPTVTWSDWQLMQAHQIQSDQYTKHVSLSMKTKLALVSFTPSTSVSSSSLCSSGCSF
jgi:hypothetical protein